MVPASILFGASRLVSMVHGVKNVPLPKCNLSESLIFELGLILFHLLTVINTLCSWVRSIWLICWNIPIAIIYLIFLFTVRSQLVQFHITCLMTCICPLCLSCTKIVQMKICYELFSCTLYDISICLYCMHKFVHCKPPDLLHHFPSSNRTVFPAQA
jgi:hypothetical protein